MKALNDDKTRLDAIERKEGGNLLVKSLHEYVSKSDLLETEYLTTMLVVVPKDKTKDFENNYWQLEAQDRTRKQELDVERVRAMEEQKKTRAEQMEKQGKKMVEDAGPKKVDVQEETPEEAQAKAAKEAAEARKARLPKCDAIVPNSLKKLTEDNEHALYKIIVLKKGPQETEITKAVLRAERYTVRPFDFDPDAARKSAEAHKKLAEKIYKDWTLLVSIAKAKFTTVFVAWIHIKAIRVFVESVLRYGLAGGANYAIALVQPNPAKNEAKTRKALQGLYKHLGEGEGGTKDDEEALMNQFGEFFPYVSVTVDMREKED